jgi:hypothetical protein
MAVLTPLVIKVTSISTWASGSLFPHQETGDGTYMSLHEQAAFTHHTFPHHCHMITTSSLGLVTSLQFIYHP